MPNAAFDNLILSPLPLPTGAASSAPPLGTGRDFGDELKRAGQPLTDSASDSNKETSSSATASYDQSKWLAADSLSGYQTDWAASSSGDRYIGNGNQTVESSDRQTTNRTSEIDSTNRPTAVNDRYSAETQSGGYHPQERPNRTHENDDSRDKSSTDASTNSAAGQSATAKPPTNNGNPSPPVKEANEGQSSEKNKTVGPDASVATANDQQTAAELLPSSQSVGADGRAPATASAGSAAANATAKAGAAAANATTVAADAVVTQTGAVASNVAAKQGEDIPSSGKPESNIATQNAAADSPSDNLTIAATAKSQTLSNAADEQTATQTQVSSSAPQATNCAQAETSGVVAGVTQKGKRQGQSVDGTTDTNQLNQSATINLAAVADSTVSVTVASTDATSSDKRSATTDRAADQSAQPVASANTSASLSGNTPTSTSNASASNASASLAAGGADAKFTVGGQHNNTAQVDQVRFVQRVANAFKAADEQGGQIRLRLSPPELGSLKVEVSIRNGTMSARLETENNTTRSLLLDSLPALRERLAGQNIKIDRFDVDLKQDGTGNGSANLPREFADSRQNLSQQQNGGRLVINRGETNSTSSGVGASNAIGNGQINIVV